MPRSDTIIEAGRWRGPVLAVSGVAAVTVLSWLYLVRMNAGMAQSGMSHMAMSHMAMPAAPPGLAAQLLAASVMWSIMMVAMMLPTALPAVAVFDNLARRRALQAATTTPTSLYVVGYLAAWTAYSVVAAAGQIALARAALLTPMLQSASVALSAVILLTAGAFQFTALKNACLSKCRTPFAYFLAEWQDGKAGALRLGLKHGSFCVGCCWALMGVMFVVGAMNLVWMGALTLFMLGEKVAPAHWRVREASGAVLVLWGLAIAVSFFRGV
jgi:predicted metal-binding membrane protein